MPTYSYKCNACDGVFDAILPISKRELPFNEPCELCSATGTVERKFDGVDTPGVAIDSNFRVDRPHNHNGFRDAIERVCESPTLDRASRDRLRQKHLPN